MMFLIAFFYHIGLKLSNLELECDSWTPRRRRRVRGGELEACDRRADAEDEEEGRPREGQQEQEGWVVMKYSRGVL